MISGTRATRPGHDAHRRQARRLWGGQQTRRWIITVITPGQRTVQATAHSCHHPQKEVTSQLTSILLAGQVTDAGRVDIANIKGSFKVETTTRSGWFTSASHPDKRR